MKNDQFNLGTSFEEKLIQALMLDHKFAEQIFDVLQPKYFNLSYLQSIASCFIEYYKQHNVFPSVDLLESIAKNTEEKNAAITAQIERYFAKIRQQPLNGDAPGIKEMALEFCRKQNILIAIERCLALTEKLKFDQIVKEITDAAALGSERDVGHVWEKSFEERMSEAARKPVATPWQPINNITQGGLSAGEVAVLLALTGVGKSHALVDLGAFAAMSGLKVVHITLELSEIQTGKRYDSRIANVPFDELKAQKEYVQNCVAEVKGRIRIKKVPSRKATVGTIRAYFSKLKMEEFCPDVLIIDYADLMKSSKDYNDKRMEQEAVYDELVSLAEELKVPTWTAAQTNRAGMDVEVLTLKHIAECFNKSHPVHLFITMNRVKNGNSETMGNMFVAKNRMGEDGIKFNAVFDTSRSRIKCLSPGGAEEHEANLKFDLELEMDPQERMRKKLRKMRTMQEAREEQQQIS